MLQASENMKIKCVSKFLCECGVRDSLQIFYNKENQIRYCRVRHRDANKRFYYHPLAIAYVIKELESHRETLSQTEISLSSNSTVDLDNENKGQNGQIESSTILESIRASSSVRIEHQPPKLGVEGSNPSPPATVHHY
jgi:hypothetical protein